MSDSALVILAFGRLPFRFGAVVFI
jgi:hypothetical protein